MNGSCERQHHLGVGGKDLEGQGRAPKDGLSRHLKPKAPPQPMVNCLPLHFARGAKWVWVEVKEIGIRFQQRGATGPKARKVDTPRLSMALQSLENNIPPLPTSKLVVDL